MQNVFALQLSSIGPFLLEKLDQEEGQKHQKRMGADLAALKQRLMCPTSLSDAIVLRLKRLLTA